MQWIKANESPKVRDRYFVKTKQGYGKGAATYDPKPIYGGSNWDMDDVIEWLDESPEAPVKVEGQEELWNEFGNKMLYAFPQTTSRQIRIFIDQQMQHYSITKLK